MKKVLTFLTVALFGQLAMANSIAWASGAISFNGTQLKNNSNVSGYLIYLGENKALADSYIVDETFAVDNIGELAQSVSGTPKSGKTTGTLKFTYGKDAYTNGSTFALLLKYDDGSDIYYQLSSTIHTMYGMTDEVTGPDDWSNFAVTGTIGTDGSLSAGSGWTKAAATVPEPATGALALAGLALLFKRRRA